MSFRNFRLLPLLILVAMLAFSVRMVDVGLSIFALSGQAFAHAGDNPGQQKEQADAANKKKEKEGGGPEPQPVTLPNPEALTGSMDNDKKGALQFPDMVPPPAAPQNGADNNIPPPPSSPSPDLGDKDKDKPIGWQAPTDMDAGLSKSQADLGDDLAQRRAALEQREKELQTKEALLKAGEQALDRKFQELTQLRGEIEKLLKQQSAEESARVDSLVKIYEGMKPADAARIFDTLDLDILVSVMTKMSERKLSPVMAAMNPERAKTVTTMMAQQKQLPTLPPAK